MALNRTTLTRYLGRVKGMMAVVVVVVYLAMTSFYFFEHAVGVRHVPEDNPIHYMWIWDMFPNFVSESSRYFVIGTASDGRIVQLIPSPNDQFRWGVGNVASRLDLNSKSENLPISIDTALERYQQENLDNPVETVYIIKSHWLAKYNFPDDLYEKEYGIKKVTRKYWELLRVRNVNENGTVIWGN